MQQLIKVGWHDVTLFVYFFEILQCIPDYQYVLSITFIQYSLYSLKIDIIIQFSSSTEPV
jgi:hypothetical protein